MKSEQPFVSYIQEIGEGVLCGCEGIHVSTVRLVKSCMSLFVERLHQDEGADEIIDVDQVRTERLVRSGQSIDLFAQ